jgi:galactokinase
VRRAGPQVGLFGGKISGAGSGGTVVVLARSDALARVVELANRHAAATGRAARVFSGSSPGAAALPVLKKTNRALLLPGLKRY